MSDELTQLRAEMAQLQARVDAYEQQPEDQPVGRRNMLRALGAAGAGAAVGGLALARPAAAVNGEPMLVGQTEDAANSTVLRATGTGGGNFGAFHVTNDTTQDNINLTASCISAVATGSGGGAQDIAFAGAGSRIGAKLDGPVPLKLTDSTNSGAPTSASGTRGQFKVDGGDLYFCVKSAPNGVWRLIAAEDDPPTPTTPLEFNPITPYRAYSSQFTDGPITADGNRTVSVKDSIDAGTGAIVTADILPASATAISCNLTAVSTTAPGFLAITPASAASTATSSVNYVSATLAVANAAITSLSGNREVKVFIGGTPGHTSEFIIDVTGYWA